MMFLSVFILTAPIHCRGSSGQANDVMPYFSKSVPRKKQTHVHLGWPEGEHIFSKFASLVNYSFKMLSMWAAHYVFEQSFAVKKRTKGFSHRSGKSFELRLPNWLSKQLTCMFNIGTHMQFSLCFMRICFFPFDSSSVSLFSVLFLINRIWSIISLSPHSMMWMRKDPQWYRTTWLDIKQNEIVICFHHVWLISIRALEL